MSFEPPAIPPSYTPPQPPSYAQPPARPQQQPQPPQQQPQPSYAQQQPRHPGYGQQPAQPGQPPRPKNTLGLVSAILGASGFLLGFLFTFIQLGIYASSSSASSYGLLSGTQSVLDVLLGLGAVALGVIGYLRGGPSKLLAIVGTTLGVALLLGVLNGLIFTIALPLIY